jgi:hypothetical protein
MDADEDDDGSNSPPKKAATKPALAGLKLAGSKDQDEATQSKESLY